MHTGTREPSANSIPISDSSLGGRSGKFSRQPSRGPKAGILLEEVKTLPTDFITFTGKRGGIGINGNPEVEYFGNGSDIEE